MTAFQVLRIILIVAVIICAMGAFFQRELVFPGEKLPQNHAFVFAKPGEEVGIRTADGVDLNALVYRRHGSRRIILFFHGNAGSLETWGSIFQDYQYLKTDLIVFDYRGYGKSGGKVSEKGLNLDGQAVYDHARKLGYAESDIIVYGRSVGCGPAVDLAQGKKLGGLILESPYHSLRGLIYRRYWYMLPWFYLAYTFDNRAKLPKVPAKVLIVHGTRDEVIPFEYGKLLADARKDSLTFVPIEGGGHNDLDGFKAKRDAVGRFLGLERGAKADPPRLN
jgi:fermentation-respiration switch protein FrsA (DUF1100 family)